MIAIAPATLPGTHLYYQRDHLTNSFVLGGTMFTGAMVLDAIITVPLFIIPNGGNHISFFTYPGFWLIGIGYATVVAIYWLIKVIKSQLKQVS